MFLVRAARVLFMCCLGGVIVGCWKFASFFWLSVCFVVEKGCAFMAAVESWLLVCVE